MEELEPFRQYFSKFREKQFRRAGLGLQFFKIRRKPAPETIPLSAFEAFSCRGKVLGVLKQKS